MSAVQRPWQRPMCLDPIRIEAADFILKEKARSRTKTETLASRAKMRRNRLTDDLCALQRGEVDKGLEYFFRLVEALDHDVVVTFVPKKARQEQAA